MSRPVSPNELKFNSADALPIVATALLVVPFLGFYFLHLAPAEQIALAGGLAAVHAASGGFARLRRAAAFFVGMSALAVFLDFRDLLAPSVKHSLTGIQLVPAAWNHHGDIPAWLAAAGGAPVSAASDAAAVAANATVAAATTTATAASGAVAAAAPASAHAPAWFAWVAVLPAPVAQFAAGLALALLGLVAFVVVALLIGRVYCSVVCPLGILQDFVFRVTVALRQGVGGKRFRLPWRPARDTLRNAVLAGALLAVLAGWGGLALAWLDPYSHFGRVSQEIFRPLLQCANNWAVNFYEARGLRDVIARTPVPWAGLGVFLPALLFLSLVTVLSALRGRLYCNALCPVGTLLGWLSRFALWRVAIDRTSCHRCGECSRVCKAQCIDLRTQTVDASRCVACFNCLEVCDDRGIRPSWLGKAAPLGKLTIRGATNAAAAPATKKPATRQSGTDAPTACPVPAQSRTSVLLVSPAAACATNDRQGARPPPAAAAPAITRRAFLAGTAGVAAAGAAGIAGFSPTADAASRVVAPPGAVSRQRFLEACTGCQLCVGACPSHVLVPAFADYGTLGGFMKPRMDYEVSFCNINCVRCGEVCPDGALLRLLPADKPLTRIGIAKVVIEKCIVRTEGTACGACAEHCPTAALKMEKPKSGAGKFTEPVVYGNQCVGCGACEFACPAKPIRAVTVHGLAIHEKAVEEVAAPLPVNRATEDFVF